MQEKQTGSNESALAALLVALRSPNGEEKATAARRLGELRDVRAVEGLIEALGTSIEGREMLPIIEALGRIRDRRAVMRLKGKLSLLEGFVVAGSAARALGDIGDPSALEDLACMFENPRSLDHRMMGEDLAYALGAIGGDRAFGALRQGTLKRCTYDHPQAFDDRSVEQVATAVVTSHRFDALEWLLEALDSSAERRTLYAYGEPLARAIAELVERGAPECQTSALERLARLGDTLVIPRGSGMAPQRVDLSLAKCAAETELRRRAGGA